MTLVPNAQMPTADREKHDFASEIGEIVARTTRLFRGESVAVIVNVRTKRFGPISAEIFCTWSATRLWYAFGRSTADALISFFRFNDLD